MIVNTYQELQMVKQPYMVVDKATMLPTHRYIWLTDVEATQRNKRLEDDGSTLVYELEPKVITTKVEKPKKETYCLW